MKVSYNYAATCTVKSLAIVQILLLSQQIAQIFQLFLNFMPNRLVSIFSLTNTPLPSPLSFPGLAINNPVNTHKKYRPIVFKLLVFKMDKKSSLPRFARMRRQPLHRLPICRVRIGHAFRTRQLFWLFETFPFENCDRCSVSLSLPCISLFFIMSVQ